MNMLYLFRKLINTSHPDSFAGGGAVHSEDAFHAGISPDRKEIPVNSSLYVKNSKLTAKT